MQAPIYFISEPSNVAAHTLAWRTGLRLYSEALKSRHRFVGRYRLARPYKGKFTAVTELAGEPITSAQLRRMVQRYVWASQYCKDRDILDIACGSGAGIGLFVRAAGNKRVCGGDIDSAILMRPVLHYKDRAEFCQLDAMALPFRNESFDVVILFEAIYYLSDARTFFKECRRILRPGGFLLLSTANKDLYDFNPSPMSTQYPNAPAMNALLMDVGFSTSFFGGSPVTATRFREQIIRALKFIAARLRIIPGSMKGKRLLKQIVFGQLYPMPVELTGDEVQYEPPVPISAAAVDTRNQFIYCAARRL
jgi:ubiquinone/menaquinone biosynthesis C-methylase UbiE